MACCPFHGEKTPSFTVSRSKQFYHCFGCGAHGDVIKFVMEYQSINFNLAVQHLSAQMGMQIRYDDGSMGNGALSSGSQQPRPRRVSHGTRWDEHAKKAAEILAKCEQDLGSYWASGKCVLPLTDLDGNIGSLALVNKPITHAGLLLDQLVKGSCAIFSSIKTDVILCCDITTAWYQRRNVNGMVWAVDSDNLERLTMMCERKGYKVKIMPTSSECRAWADALGVGLVEIG